jgi:EmrB/QacA subfamily drug resistance transporter
MSMKSSFSAIMRRRLVTAACMLAAFMVAVEATIVATAMPTIVGDLGSFQLFSWVFAAFILTTAVTSPIYGRLADLYGRKRVFYVGALMFLVGSTLCGFASSMGLLIAFRTLQGLGGGALLPLSTTIVGDIYSPEDRARMQAWLASVWGVAAIAGPILGSFIVEHLPWALVFWINLPIGAITIALFALFFDEPTIRRAHRVDYLGALLLMIGAGAVLVAIVQAESLPRPALIGLLGVGIVALVILFMVERAAPEPIIPFSVWRVRTAALSNVGSLLSGTILTCITVFLPTYVQGAMGRSATIAGFTLTAQTMGWTLASIPAARMMMRTSYRITGLVGAISLVIGTAILIWLEPSRGPLFAGCGAGFVGIGMGFCNTMFIVACQTGMSWNERGSAVSSNLFTRSIGMSLGAGLGGAIVNYSLSALPPQIAQDVRRVLIATERAALPQAEFANISAAIGAALHKVYLVAGALSVLMLLVMLLYPAQIGAGAPADDPASKK